MADEYKAFQEGFGIYAELTQHTNEAKVNYNINNRGRYVIAAEHENEAIKNRILNLNDPAAFGILAEKTMNRKKAQLESLVNSDEKVNAIVGQMSKPEIVLGLGVTPIKDVYEGNNAALYNEIGKLKKSVDEYEAIIKSKDGGKIAQVVQSKITPGFNENDKEAYAVLSKLDSQLDEHLFMDLYKGSAKGFAEKIKNHEKDFLAASLDKNNFIEFYIQLQDEAKAQQQKASQES